MNLKAKRTIKVKGKLVVSSTKKGDRKYVTMGMTQKCMSNAMIANKAQTILNCREREVDNTLVMNPTIQGLVKLS